MTGFAWAVVALTLVAPPADRPVRVTVTEGTNLAVTASADRIVIDVQGELFSLPRKGGRAKSLGHDLDPFWPAFSPDGSRLAVQSFADGMFHLRTLAPDGGDVRQVTFGEHDDLHPAWSPDGTKLAFTSDRAGTEDIWTVDARGGPPTRVTSAASRESQPTWSPDGRRIAYIRDNTVESIDLGSSEVRTEVPAGTGFVAAPTWSPDGLRIAFVRSNRLFVAESGVVRQIGASDDVFPFPARWLSAHEVIYGANGRIRVSDVRDGVTRVVPFSATFTLDRPHYQRKRYDFDSRRPRPVRGIVGPALSPDGRTVVFKALNDLWLLPIGGTPRRITRDAFYETDPAWSRDGRLAYASDKAGTEDLYVWEAGVERRVTALPGAEVAPAWSPDGKVVAFQDENHQTFTLDLASGVTTRVLGPQNAPGRPSWSADGRTLALTVSVAERNQILLLDLASGVSRVVEPAPYASISTRGDDGPVWSPDGRSLAFSMHGTLWVLPVDPAGTPTGPARRVTDEASDAPTWSGDSKWLLYLHNGRLRKTTVDGRVEDVSMDLSFTRAQPSGRTVIHAGRLWDGRHPEPRTDVDIVVVGNRVERIEPHRADRPRGTRYVDASGLTVTPGLIDLHVHQEMRSRFVGDRQGRLLLSYGITTTRSTGDPAYRALEDRESLDAGTRAGPRFFATGEMLEGSRPSWEFARPVRDERQLELELTRVRELDYDLVKTYERFRVDWQARVADRAHRLGVPTTSHYLYPAVAHGVDMKEHVSAPSKWGFGFARERSAGGVYEDVVRLAAHLPITTTLFSSGSLLADDPDLVTDPRVRTLYTGQEQRALTAKLLCAQGRGPCGFLDGTPEQARRDVEVVKRLRAGGAVVVVGTDMPLDSAALSLHLNLRALVKYGLTPFEALRAATRDNARQLGVEADLGSIEEGKLADLVVTGGDPSRDIGALADVRMVVRNGALSTVDDLLKPYR